MKWFKLILYKAALFTVIGLHIFGFGVPVLAIELTLIGLVCLIGISDYLICKRVVLITIVMWFAYLIDVPLQHRLFSISKPGHISTGKNLETGEVCLVFRRGLFSGSSEHSYVFERWHLFSSEHLNGVPEGRGFQYVDYSDYPPHAG